MPEPPMPPGFAYPPITALEIVVCLAIVGLIALPLWRAARREFTRYKRITWR